MGMVYAEILLKNAKDIYRAEDGFIQEQEIRQTNVTATVDTGAITMVINEKLRQELGLGIRGERPVSLANNAEEIVKIADPVEIHWKNRSVLCSPLVISGDGKILLGVVPLEEMDLMVNPVTQELVGVHGDEVVSYLL